MKETLVTIIRYYFDFYQGLSSYLIKIIVTNTQYTINGYIMFISQCGVLI